MAGTMQAVQINAGKVKNLKHFFERKMYEESLQEQRDQVWRFQAMQRQKANRPIISAPQRLYKPDDLGVLAFNARMRHFASVKALGFFIGFGANGKPIYITPDQLKDATLVKNMMRQVKFDMPKEELGMLRNAMGEVSEEEYADLTSGVTQTFAAAGRFIGYDADGNSIYVTQELLRDPQLLLERLRKVRFEMPEKEVAVFRSVLKDHISDQKFAELTQAVGRELPAHLRDSGDRSAIEQNANPLFTAVTHSSFEAVSQYELSLAEGEKVKVFDVHEDGWCLVKVEGQDGIGGSAAREERIGWVPKDFLDRCDDEPETRRVSLHDASNASNGLQVEMVEAEGTEIQVEDVSSSVDMQAILVAASDFSTTLIPSASDRQTVLEFIERSGLFSELPRGTALEVYVEDVDRLLRAGKTLAGTLAALLQLDRDLLKFGSLKVLCDSAKQVVDEWERSVVPEAQKIIEQIFGAHKVHHVNIMMLITESTCGKDLPHRITPEIKDQVLDEFEDDAEIDQDELIQVLAEAQTDFDDKRAAFMCEQREKVYEYLRSTSRPLFRGFLDLRPNPVEQLLHAGGMTGQQIVDQLEVLDSDDGVPFSDLGSMMRAVFTRHASAHDITDEVQREVLQRLKPPVVDQPKNSGKFSITAVEQHSDVNVASATPNADDDPDNEGLSQNQLLFLRSQKLMQLLSSDPHAAKLLSGGDPSSNNLRVTKTALLELLQDSEAVPSFAELVCACQVLVACGVRLESFDQIRPAIVSGGSAWKEWKQDLLDALPQSLMNSIKLPDSKILAQLVVTTRAFHPELGSLLIERHSNDRLKDLIELRDRALLPIGQQILSSQAQYEQDIVDFFTHHPVFTQPVAMLNTHLDRLVLATPGRKSSLVVPQLRKLYEDHGLLVDSFHELLENFTKSFN